MRKRRREKRNGMEKSDRETCNGEKKKEAGQRKSERDGKENGEEMKSSIRKYMRTGD